MLKSKLKRAGAFIISMVMVITLVANVPVKFSPLQNAVFNVSADANSGVTFKVQIDFESNGVTPYYHFVSVAVNSNNYRSVQLGWPAELNVNAPAKPTGWTVTQTGESLSIIMNSNYTAADIQNYLQGLKFSLKVAGTYPDGKASFTISVKEEQVAYFKEDGYEHFYQYFRFYGGVTAKNAKNEDVLYPLDPLHPVQSNSGTDKRALLWMQAYNMAQAHVYITEDGDVLRGYLATITSEEEQRAIYDSVAVECGWLAGTRLLYNNKIIKNDTPTVIGNINKNDNPYYNYNAKNNKYLRLGVVPKTTLATAGDCIATISDGMGFLNLPFDSSWTSNPSTASLTAKGYIAHGGTSAPKLSEISTATDYYWYWSDGPEDGALFLNAPTSKNASGGTAGFRYGTPPKPGTELNDAFPIGDFDTASPKRGYTKWIYFNAPATKSSSNADYPFNPGEPNDSTNEFCLQFAYKNNECWNDFSPFGGDITSKDKQDTKVNGYYVEYSRKIPEKTNDDDDTSANGNSVPPPVPVQIRYISLLDNDVEVDYSPPIVINETVIGKPYVAEADTERRGYKYVGYSAERSGTGPYAAPQTGTNPFDAVLYPAGSANANGVGTTEVDEVRGTVQAYPQFITFLYKPDKMTVTFHPNWYGDPTIWEGLNKVFPKDKLVYYEQPYGTLATASREGYDFRGWFLDPQCTPEKEITSATPVTNITNHTLYAKWTPKVPYEVRYDLNGGKIGGQTTTPSQKLLNWESTNLLPPAGNPTRSGYTFIGWNVSINGSGVDITDTNMYGNIAENEVHLYITLQAQWTEAGKVAVKYDLNGGNIGGAISIPDKINVLHDESNLLPAKPTKTGSNFLGWMVFVDGALRVHQANSTETFDEMAGRDDATVIKLVAIFTEKSHFEVRYDLDGGSINNLGTYPTYENVGWSDRNLLPDRKPVKPGYSFAGWKVKATDGKGKIDVPVINGDSYGEIAEDDKSTYIELIASWTESSLFMVKYDLNGAETPATINDLYEVEWDQDHLAPNVNPTRKGYAFGGWVQLYKDGTTSDYSVGTILEYGELAESPNDKSITLQAKWTPKSIYTVVYDLNGATGSLADKNLVNWAQTNLLPTDRDLTKGKVTPPTGTHLGGWILSTPSGVANSDKEVTTNSAYGVLAEDENTLTITLQAYWVTADIYKVYYDTNGADTPASISGATLTATTDTVTLPTNLTKVGYTLGGWTVTDNRNATIASGYTAAETDTFAKLAETGAHFITLKAVWIPVVYKVNYNLNLAAGQTTSPTSIASIDTSWTGKKLTPASTPVSRGYLFVGWFTTPAGTIEVNSGTAYNTIVANDRILSTTLYAQWVADSKYVVKYDLDGGKIGSNTSVPEKSEVYWGDGSLTPTIAPTKTGYEFIGWRVYENANTEIAANYIVQSEDTFGKLALSRNVGYIGIQAVWAAHNNYNVVYDLNTVEDNIAAVPASYDCKLGLNWNSKYLLPDGADPTRDKYTFLGWYSQAVGGFKATDNNKYGDVADDARITTITLYAHWQPVPHTVKYIWNGATSGVVADRTNVGWSENNLLLAPVKTGYIFQGWTLKYVGTVNGDGHKVTDSEKYSELAGNAYAIMEVTLEANWEVKSNYRVSYDGGGAPLSPEEKNNVSWTDDNLIPQEPIIYPGRTFVRWDGSTNTNGKTNVTSSDAFADLAEDEDVSAIILKAIWKDNDYTVHYDYDDDVDNKTPDKTVKWDDSIDSPDPHKPGYTHTGWEIVDSDGSVTEIDGDEPYKTLVPNDKTPTITIRPKFSLLSYGVNYEWAGAVTGIINDKTNVKYSDKITFPTPTKTCAKFIGWEVIKLGNDLIIPYLAKGDETYKQIAQSDKLMTITLRAVWQEYEYTVHYDTDGDTNGTPPDVKIKFDEDIPVPTPNKPGYNFDGWIITNKDGSVTDIIVGDDGDVPSYRTLVDGDETITSITLHPKWTYKSFGVIYEWAGATSGTTGNKVVKYSDEIPFPIPAKIGSTFAGWEVIALGGDNIPPYVLNQNECYKDVAKSDTITKIVLRAIWEDKLYTVYYDGNGGSSVNPVSTKWSNNNLSSPVPVREGYTFIGWTLKTADKTYTGASVTPNLTYGKLAEKESVKSIELLANWTKNIYKIVYDWDNSNIGVVPNQDIGYNEKIVPPLTNPKKPGYDFDGWEIIKRGDDEIIPPRPLTDDDVFKNFTDGDDSIKTITMRPRWKDHNFTVSFDTNGGTDISPKNNVKWHEDNLTSGVETTRKGYKFVCWTLKTVGKEYTGTTITDNLDYAKLAETDTCLSLELFARWEPLLYTLIFVDNEGNVVKKFDYVYDDDSTKTLNELRKFGYILRGEDIDYEGMLHVDKDRKIRVYTLPEYEEDPFIPWGEPPYTEPSRTNETTTTTVTTTTTASDTPSETLTSYSVDEPETPPETTTTTWISTDVDGGVTPPETTTTTWISTDVDGGVTPPETTTTTWFSEDVSVPVTSLQVVTTGVITEDSHDNVTSAPQTTKWAITYTTRPYPFTPGYPYIPDTPDNAKSPATSKSPAKNGAKTTTTDGNWNKNTNDEPVPPKTGDESIPFAWLLFAAIASGITLSASAVSGRRKKSK